MKCIVCLIDKNLNTHMKVEIDNENYEVHLCDEHAETTTMAQVTKKVKEIKDKLKNAVQLAIDLGISIPEINIKPNNDAIGVMPDLDIVPDQSTPEASEPTPQKVDKNKIKRQAVPVKLSDEEEINCDTEIEMQRVEVKGGKVDIPKHTSGDAGSTDIRIIESKDDIIQQRFKSLKEIGDSGAQVPTGYLNDCRACNGTGVHPILKKECPKCGGRGVIG